MCGIAGFCDKNENSKEIIRKMCEAMIQRGPDAFGQWHDESTGITLGHQRLSIVDLSENGAQPMISHNQRYVISYNGEVYNADILRNKLIQDKKVVAFRGSSDTEVVLEMFAAYGLRAIEQIKGMFAIALFDRDEKKLYLLRDRMGEKPLYYGYVRGKFVFASDIAVIKKMEGFDNPICKEAVSLYLKYGFVPAPFSIYEKIFKLQPGFILETKVPCQTFELFAYWSAEAAYRKGEENPFIGTEKEATEELERKIKDSVKGQMVSDVPLGAFLSGGIDSSLIVSMMQQVGSKKTKTFSIGFKDEAYNEAKYAKEIADHLGTDHTELYLDEQDLRQVIPKLSTIYTEPFADSSQIPTYLVSKLAKSKVTVSLSGDAGDELFCGYNTYYKVDHLWNQINKIPVPLRKIGGRILADTPLRDWKEFHRMGKSLLSKDIESLQEAVCYELSPWRKRTQLLDTTLEYTSHPELADTKSRMMLQDICRYLPDDILVKVDRAGMAVSLENRVPLLDKDIVEFAFSLPLSYKYQKGKSKKILKDILYQYVPKEMLDRPKKGFSVPIEKWLSEGETYEWAREMIDTSQLCKDDILNGEIVAKVWERFQQTKKDKSLVWKVLMLEQWYRDR